MRERDQLIVSLLNTGDFNLDQVGEKVGLSHEGVRLIYKKVTGGSHTTYLRKKKRSDYLNEVKYKCASCQKEVKRKDMMMGIKYCKECSVIVREIGRTPWITKTCEQCGKEYHPRRRYLSDDLQSRFCKLDCWYTYKTMA